MKFSLPLFLFLFLSSCTNLIKDESKNTSDEALSASATNSPGQPAISENITVVSERDMIGSWVGMFEPDTSLEPLQIGESRNWNYNNKITISIDSIVAGTVKGHSVVAGNERPFTGTLERTQSSYRFLVKEPGDDKYDGEFHFTIMPGDSLLKGKWKAYGQIKIPARRYALSKKIFRYNPDYRLEERTQYIDWSRTKKRPGNIEGEEYYEESYFTTTDEVLRYNASGELLTPKQVANMTKADIFILRNSIYARHGYSYKNRQLRAYFDRQSWYMPVKTDIKGELTPLEKQNIELLLRYEKNAQEYYDEFGRG